MSRTSIAAALLTVCLGTASVQASDALPGYIGKYQVTPQDTQLINKVVEDFSMAIKTKNVKLLSSLLVNDQILFESPIKPDQFSEFRSKHDPKFDGIRGGGYPRFARFVGESSDQLEEKFYNVKITQDGNVAWVMFDYEFLVSGKTQNYGIETWQMIKLPGDQWKIASVVWTMNRAPK